MKKFLPFLCLFLLNAPAFAGNDCRTAHPEWTSCHANADCVLIPDACGFPTDGVNKPHEKEALACNKAEAAHTECFRGYNPKTDGPWRAVCNDGVCASAQIVK